jgi:GTP cyclohydrolase I
MIELVRQPRAARYHSRVSDKRQRAVRDFLATLPAGVDRAALRATPERVSAAWDELLSGYGQHADALIADALFPAESRDEVRVAGLAFHSVCEHHLLPFFGIADIRYTPGKKILGLSKFPAVVNAYARRLQVQERLTAQIADALAAVLKPKRLEVTLTARHLCLEMRGQRQGGELITTAER